MTEFFEALDYHFSINGIEEIEEIEEFEYDDEGYDKRGFDKDGIHKKTKTKFNGWGFDKFKKDERGEYYNKFSFNYAGFHKHTKSKTDTKGNTLNFYLFNKNF